MRVKKGNKLPTKGTLLPDDTWHSPNGKVYAALVAKALRRQVGNTHGATKRVMRWTGASERTVKNWFAGTKGPNGMHLIGLIRNSDEVYGAFLKLTDREPSSASHTLENACAKLLEILKSLGRDQRGASG